MAKIVSMSSGAIDPIAQSKRVFFRADTTTASLKVGRPVCYDSDCVHDHKERTADPTHLGLTLDTYAEGEQEFTGRLFVVEEPLTANLHAFAGIVKALGPKAGADNDMIEIFVPTPGAIVPVWTDQNCVFDRTIMAIRDSEADVSYPGVPIGIAKETKDRSAAADNGLIWMQFNDGRFLPVPDDSGLIIEDECGASVVINRMHVISNQTAGTFCMLKIDGQLDGAGNMSGGIVFVRAALNAAADSICNAVHIGLILEAGAEIVYSGSGPGGGRYVNSILDLTMQTSGTPDLSTAVGATLSGISFNYGVDETGGEASYKYVFHFNSHATYTWDGLIMCMNNGDIGDATVTNAVVTDQDGAGDRVIPIRIANNNYYLRAFVKA